jgi:hypothetical protein
MATTSPVGGTDDLSEVDEVTGGSVGDWTSQAATAAQAPTTTRDHRLMRGFIAFPVLRFRVRTVLRNPAQYPYHSVILSRSIR